MYCQPLPLHDALPCASSVAADKRGRCKGVASNAELALEFAALEHRAPRGVDKAGAGRTHHSSSATSSIRSRRSALRRSEEHTSELQSLMRNSYAVFCLKKKTITHT